MTTQFTEEKREALEFLRTKNSVGTLATVDGSNQPFVSPVYYVMGNDFDFYFFTTKASNKAKNIGDGAKVAFCVGAGPEYISVMIRGLAVPATFEECQLILPRFAEKAHTFNTKQWPIETLEDLKHAGLVFYKVNAENVTFLNINSTQEPNTNTDHLYHIVG